MTASRCTVRTFKDNGPYFTPTIMQYSAESLERLLFHTRMAMEDGEDIIAIYHGDQCTGLWQREAEGEPDGEGGWQLSQAWYEKYRPSESFSWKWLTKQITGKAS